MTPYCDLAPGREWHRPSHEMQCDFPIDDRDQLSAKRKSDRLSAQAKSFNYSEG